MLRADLVTAAVLSSTAAPELDRCPRTGWPLHLDHAENARVRAELLERGLRSPRERALQVEACRRSPAWFVAHFGWTFLVREVDAEGRTVQPRKAHVPFIPWACQVRAINELIESIESGRDVLVDKSRDMGASWICGAFLPSWYFLFVPDSQSLLTSRVEPLVDRRGDPDAIMWKLDYVHGRLPAWLLPCAKDDIAPGGEHRQHLILRNPANGATVTGQATTEHIGRAGRRTFVLLDEMAAMDNQAALWRSAADTTSCRIANSTPIGTGKEFSRLRTQGLETGSPRVVRLTYEEHPQKGANGEYRTDTDGSVTGFVGLRYWWSPWFAEECKRRDRVDVAQNILCIHEIAGLSFFDPVAVTRALRDDVREPVRGDIELDPEQKDNPDLRRRVRFVQRDDGPFRVYEMPLRNAAYGIGADPSYGVGAANSAAFGFNADSGEQAFDLEDPTLGPFELAHKLTLASWFWAGRQHKLGALTAWETNGPGAGFWKDLQHHGHRNLYRPRLIGQVVETTTLRYGWDSTTKSKVVLLGDLNRSMKAAKVRLRSATLLRQMLAYQVTDSGRLDTPQHEDLTTGARAAHGDLVIGAALARLAIEEATPAEEERKDYAPGTYGAVLKHRERRGLIKRPPSAEFGGSGGADA